MKKNVIMWALVLGTTVPGLISCGGGLPQPAQESYETVTIKKEDITVPIKFSAKLKGETDVTITPQVSGQLMKICVTEGQQVKKGQTLFIIDSRNAQLDLQSAQANLQAAIASENSAKLEYESNKNLYEKKIVSKYMLDNAENTYKQAQASVAQARSTVNSAKVNLGFCTITAPVAGLIGEISVRTGDQVSPGTQLTMVSGNLQMDAEFSVPESLIEETVSAGTKASDREKILSSLPEVTFLMKNGTEYTHKGRVSSLTGMVNATTGTISCKATFPNPDGQLFSGIQGTVVMPYAVTDVIVIPQTAVVKLQSKQQVYKVKADSTATAVEVKTEDIGNGQDFIVTSGLNVGDEIITIGSNNVQEGQKVLFPESRDKN
jgi:membrane fusion protein (multidrug efflux system)